jgi:hypothetical protein
MMTQRPAVLNKNLTTQAGHLILGRIPSPQDQKAVKEWLDIHATPDVAAGILGKPLANLKKGEAIYIDTNGGEPRRITVKRRSTFDSSRTPEPGERAATATVRAPIDVQKLSGEIQELAKTAEENKPDKLRARIAELERKLAAAPAQAKAAKPPPPPPVLAPNDRRLIERVANALEGRVKAMHELADGLGQMRFAVATDQENTRTAALKIAEHLAKFETPRENFEAVKKLGDAQWSNSRTAKPLQDIRRVRELAGKVTGPAPVPQGDGTLSKVERALLTAIAQHGPIEKGTALIHSGYAPSGRVSDAWARFTREGLVSANGDGLTLTPAGAEVLGPVEPLPVGAKFRRLILKKCRNPTEAAIFKTVFNAYPESISRADAQAASGYAPSGRVSDAFARMVALGYAKPAGKKKLIANGDLFPNGDQTGPASHEGDDE